MVKLMSVFVICLLNSFAGYFHQHELSYKIIGKNVIRKQSMIWIKCG